MNFANIYEKVNKCDKCKLCKNRIINCSFRGSTKAYIMFIGEAFGTTEQSEGRPFVGRSGKLLDGILQKVGLNPETDVYITNLVKDRPIDYVTGKDRKPFYDEIITCAPYLMEELEVLNPKIVVTLGKTSGDWFADYKEYKINQYYSERKWLPLYHPSYLFRNRKEISNFIEALKNTLEKINV